MNKKEIDFHLHNEIQSVKHKKRIQIRSPPYNIGMFCRVSKWYLDSVYLRQNAINVIKIK